MSAADKLRDRHDWWNEAPDECAADIAAGDIAAMLPDIIAVIAAAEQIAYGRTYDRMTENEEKMARALAALNARLDGEA